MDSLLAKTIIENTSEAIMVTDAAACIVRVNPAFCAVTGYSPEEVLGKTPRILSSGRHDHLFYDAMWKSVHEIGFWNGKIWNRKKSGECYLQSISISAVRNHEGEICWYIASFTKIDEETTVNPMIERIMEGLDRGEFFLHYQPQVDISRGVVTGMEALIRWQHPEEGILFPSSFIDLVEKTHLAIPVGNFVMQSALSQIREWRSLGLDLRISINISPRHLESGHFIDDLKICLETFPDVPPESIHLEIIESAALENLEKVIPVMEEAIRLGVRFTLDDFGTGHSSLTYLQRLPVNTIKIDQSFVRTMHENINDLILVEAITSLAHTFQRESIAEGVESVHTGTILAQINCHQVQGYAISRPMPADCVHDWVRDWSPDPLWKKAASTIWTREDLPLLYVQIDHRRWIEEIRQILESPQGISREPEEGAENCRFGKWYYLKGKKRYSEFPEYLEVEPIHDRLHASARRLLKRLSEGNHALAKVEFQRLLAISERLHEKLSDLVRQVTGKKPTDGGQGILL